MLKPSSSTEDDSTNTTTTTSSDEDRTSDNDEDEDDDDLFVDAPEASGTLISQFLAQRLANREDLTQVTNWGGSPTTNENIVEGIVKNLVPVPQQSEVGVLSGPISTPTEGDGDTSLSGHPKVATLRSVNERVRQSKLEEARRRLDHEEDYNSDDDKLLTVTSHSTSPTSSCEALSINKYQQQPFKVIEQDSLSARGSGIGIAGAVSTVNQPPPLPTISSVPQQQQQQVLQTVAQPQMQQSPSPRPRPKSTSSAHENSCRPSRPPDIVSSCREIPDQTYLSTPSPTSEPLQAFASAPVPPPRRKKKGAKQTRSSSPTSSTQSFVVTEEKPTTSNNSQSQFLCQDDDKEKIRLAKSGTGPKVLRRTESLGLVANSAPPDKRDPNSMPSAAAGVTNPLPKPPRDQSAKSNIRRLDSPIPGSYSLPGPIINMPAEVKKHSLPILRTKTDSGKLLSDLEILEKVTVLNLDTGERIPLSSAEDKIPKCINPLTLHIMRLTSEYVSEDTTMANVNDSDDDNSSKMSTTTTSEGYKSSNRKRTTQLTKFIGNVGRKTVSKAKAIKSGVGAGIDGIRRSQRRHRRGRGMGIEEDNALSLPEEQPPPAFYQLHRASLDREQNTTPQQSLDALQPPPPVLQRSAVAGSSCARTSSTSTSNPQSAGPGPTIIKMKASPKHKGPYDFENLELAQELNSVNAGPIWCMKFSLCGRLLAAAGQDRLIKVYVLKSQLNYFIDLIKTSKVSPTPSLESMTEQQQPQDNNSGGGSIGHGSGGAGAGNPSENSNINSWPFVALSSYAGHTADLLDIAWSKSFFLLSSSMDRTVRLWHISRKECLCTFQHVDFVTAIAFHPRDDRYFLSGSLDSKVRIWNIPDKKVALWNEVPAPNNLITTANFCQNGKFAVVGTYDGRVIFYHTEQLKYHTQIILNKKRAVKISGIEPMPGEDKILVTSNDSRIRLYDLRDLSMICKYTGSVTRSSQIKASFSHDGKFIISGSENNFIYLWRRSTTTHDNSIGSSIGGFVSSARRDRNKCWEGVRCHDAVVTCAIFSPDPDLILREIVKESQQGGTASGGGGTSNTSTSTKNYSQLGYVFASADFNGQIKVFVCKIKAKCSSLPVSAIA